MLSLFVFIATGIMLGLITWNRAMRRTGSTKEGQSEGVDDSLNAIFERSLIRALRFVLVGSVLAFAVSVFGARLSAGA